MWKDNNGNRSHNFRNILTRMNSKVKLSKKKKIRMREDDGNFNFNFNTDIYDKKDEFMKRSMDDSQSARFLAIATSEGPRKFRNF